ncbi:hypothetical protein PVK06_003216 [Gossypium arboreum]|uniref:Retrovirus-related Pol polyprotein from transposon TNT 1-94 n=1 Tax=Gossypium arboreum TaxID=29729 RepID=A0ABR0R5Q5_GOSAR|nr:hypothetical protein PVK06_003216 [Gossypium arboreum]
MDDVWYFNSDCSWHMTNCQYGKVIFGDGKKGQILGKCNFNVLEMPRLKNVLRLKANLTSIVNWVTKGSLSTLPKIGV